MRNQAVIYADTHEINMIITAYKAGRAYRTSDGRVLTIAHLAIWVSSAGKQEVEIRLNNGTRVKVKER